jgi:hypothetical protein
VGTSRAVPRAEEVRNEDPACPARVVTRDLEHAERRTRGMRLSSPALALLVLVPLVLVAAPTAPADGCPAPCSGQSSSPQNAKLLYVQPNGPTGPIVAHDTVSGRVAFRLPAGASSADGRWHVSTSAFGSAATQFRRFKLENGRNVRSWHVQGRWRIAALSPNGRWAALVDPIADTPTRLALVDVARRRVVRRVLLEGRFEVETVSADGRRMFLIQHLSNSAYLVRAFDVTRNRLKTQALKASGEGAPMVGQAWSGVASPNGRWLLTLYLNTDHNHAFVHALDLVRSKPNCISLPSGAHRLDALKRYTLTLSPNGRRLYAANPALGVVAEVDLQTQRVVRTARFAASGAGASTRRLLAGTISRNGRTLYFSAGRGLWAFDAATGAVRGPYATGGRLVGFGYGPRDSTIHALRADGRMLAFDAASGRRLT